MTPRHKRWAWIGGLTAGATTLALVFWPKKASAAQKGYIGYTSTLSTAVLQAKVGSTLTIDLPSLSGTPYAWHVEGAEGLYNAAVPSGWDFQSPAQVKATFTKPGQGTIFVSKIYAYDEKGPARSQAEPPMAINVAVSA